jgi:DNA modification methylase
MPTDVSPTDNQRLSLRYVAIGQIQANPRDPRLYLPAEKARIAKALQTLGPIPLIVDQNLKLLSGNIWLEAARKAGITDIPIVTMHHLGPAEADAFMLAQVRLIENGQWNRETLGEVLRDLTLQEIDFDLSITGFDPPEIDLLILGLESREEDQDADELPEDGPKVSQVGDLWNLGDHRLLCGDARIAENYALLLGSEKANAVCADPPFNVAIKGHVGGRGKIKHPEFAMASGEMSEAAFTDFLIEVFNQQVNFSQDGSLHFVAMDWRHIHEISTAGRHAYSSLVNVCVWAKDNGGMGSLYRSQHELFFVFKNGRAPHVNNVQLGRYGRNRTNVWNYAGANSFSRNGGEGDLLRLHPTVKPVSLLADILLDASKRGDIILDPFMGSGSTLIAAEKVGRKARGMEIHPPYVDAAIRRWQRWTGEEAQLASDRRAFSEVEFERGRRS